jgi:hypothetical protein
MQAFDKHLPSKLRDHFLLGTKQCAMDVLNIDQGLSLGMFLTLMKYIGHKPSNLNFLVLRLKGLSYNEMHGTSSKIVGI